MLSEITYVDNDHMLHRNISMRCRYVWSLEDINLWMVDENKIVYNNFIVWDDQLYKYKYIFFLFTYTWMIILKVLIFVY